MPEPQTPDVPDRPRRPSTARWILAGLIACFGVVMYVVAVQTGRVDSALLFVALPVALAAALAVLPTRTTHGRVFAATTIGLLLVAVALHEGAVCVILAAPLVYLLAHGTTALLRHLRASRSYAVLALVPLVLAAGLEGAADQWRLHPVQSATVVRVMALPVEQVRELVHTGPQPTAARQLPLRLLGVPLPHHVEGAGLSPGDQWRFGYHDSAHGPGGHILTEVTEAGPDAFSFTVVEDTSIVARWLSWHAADISWRAIDAEHTEVRVSTTFERGLDPSWYFGPWQDLLMRQGMAHLLDMLDLPE